MNAAAKADLPGLDIAMLTTFYPPYNFGGDGIGVKRLATALADRGHRVTVVHNRDAYRLLAGNEPSAAEADPRIEVVGLETKYPMMANLLSHQTGQPLAQRGALQKLFARKPFDIVWYHNISLMGGPGVLALGDGVKIYEAHEHWLVCPTHVLWRYNRERCEGATPCLRCTLSYRRPPQMWRYTGGLTRQLGHVDAFIAKSEFSRAKHKAMGFPRDMEVVPYFLPDEPLKAAGSPPQDKPYFLFVGRLEKIKGVQDILPAFAGENGPELIVIGSGDYEAELRKMAAGNPRVKFTGRLEPHELSRFYAHARALIVPSICYETFGIILIESFRMGTPVIARALGPFPEIVAQGGGLLYENDRELCEAIALLGADEARREGVAREARDAFERLWTEAVVMDRYLGVIRKAAETRGNDRILSMTGE